MDFGSKFQKINVGLRINVLEIPCVRIFRENGQMWLFGPKFAQKWILGQNFKNLSLDSESGSPRYHVSLFSVKMDKFEFFGVNLGKYPNYMWHFGSNIVDSITESWVEVDGTRWRWVIPQKYGFEPLWFHFLPWNNI